MRGVLACRFAWGLGLVACQGAQACSILGLMGRHGHRAARVPSRHIGHTNAAPVECCGNRCAPQCQGGRPGCANPAPARVRGAHVGSAVGGNGPSGQTSETTTGPLPQRGGAGSKEPELLWTSARSRCFSLTWILHPERCCCPRAAKVRAARSPSSRAAQTSWLTMGSSEFFS